MAETTPLSPNDVIRKALAAESAENIQRIEFEEKVWIGTLLFGEKFLHGVSKDDMKVVNRVIHVDRVGGGQVQAQILGRNVGEEVAAIASELDPERVGELAGAIGYLLGRIDAERERVQQDG